jgi:hypothetical protein
MKSSRPRIYIIIAGEEVGEIMGNHHFIPV